MRKKFKELIAHHDIEQTPHYLLSQELEFEFAKSISTFAMAFIAGIVSLKSVLNIGGLAEDKFIYAIVSALIAALLAFESQQGVINDLRLGRCPSKLKRYYRRFSPPLMLGVAIGCAVVYFEVL